MSMTPHIFTNQVTHNWGTVVVGTETMAVKLQNGIIRALNRPASLRHGSMTSFVLLLWMPYEQISPKTSQIW